MNILKHIKEKSYLGSLIILSVLCWWFSPSPKEKTKKVSDPLFEQEILNDVRFTTVSPAPVQKEVKSWGVTEPINHSTLLIEQDGRVTEVFFKQGDIVTKGDILLITDTEKLEKDKGYLTQLVKERKNKYTAYQKLQKNNTVSEIDLISAKTDYDSALSDLENNNDAIRKSKIIAPFTGVLDNMNLLVGDFLSKNDMVAELSDISQVKITGYLTEQDINNVKPGQMATAIIANKSVTGVVSYVSRLADKDDHMFVVEIITDKAEDLYSGALSEITVAYGEAIGYAVNVSSLTLDSNLTIGVKVLDENDQINFIETSIIKMLDGKAIIEGPTGDIKLITTGGEWVSSGEKVTPTEELL